MQHYSTFWCVDAKRLSLVLILHSAPSNGFALVRIQRIRFAADCRQSRQARPLWSHSHQPRNSSNKANNYCRLFNLKSWYYETNKKLCPIKQKWMWKNILQHMIIEFSGYKDSSYHPSILVKFLGLLYQGCGFALLNSRRFRSSQGKMGTEPIVLNGVKWVAEL